MSQENVEIVRRAFDGAGARSIEQTAETFWHPDITYVEDPRWPGASTYKGRDAALRCFKQYMDALGREEDFVLRVERVIDAGARQVPFVRIGSRASASGLPHEHLWGYVVEVEDGRIIYLRAYYEPAEALEAAGLRE
jgi:ketosteroid isomerase-like protein